MKCVADRIGTPLGWLKQSRMCVLLMVSWLLVMRLSATQSTPLQLEDLTAKAQLILRGNVLSKSCQQDAAGRIYTKLQLQVAEVWKGTLATNRFTVVQGGGILGDRKVVVSGQEEYQVGEEVVVFLVLNLRGEGVSIGLAQGKFQVTKAAVTGEKYAQNIFHGHARTKQLAPSTGPRPQPDPAAGPLRLDDLKRRVQAVKP